MNISQLKEKVTETIIKKLENGVIPWRKTWKSGAYPFPINWATKKAYSGINLLLLEQGQYATFLQIKNAGGKVLKGAEATPIYFAKPLTKTVKDSNGQDKDETFFIFKTYFVFNIETQTTLEPHKLENKDFNPELYENDLENIELCEKVLSLYKDKPTIFYKGSQPAYFPTRDIIEMPVKEDFESMNEFYNTLFHELIHSTGHEKRLNRTLNTSKGSDYSYEELVAEMGAAILATMCNIEHKTIDNTAAYIDFWISRLKNDKNLIYKASKLSEQAVAYMLNETVEKKTEKETEQVS